MLYKGFVLNQTFAFMKAKWAKRCAESVYKRVLGFHCTVWICWIESAEGFTQGSAVIGTALQRDFLARVSGQPAAGVPWGGRTVMGWVRKPSGQCYHRASGGRASYHYMLRACETDLVGYFRGLLSSLSRLGSGTGRSEGGGRVWLAHDRPPPRSPPPPAPAPLPNSWANCQWLRSNK